MLQSKWNIGSILLAGVCALGLAPLHAQEAACATPLDARIENSCIVDAGTLWRGAKPSKAAATALVERGVKTVVNLEIGRAHV